MSRETNLQGWKYYRYKITHHDSKLARLGSCFQRRAYRSLDLKSRASERALFLYLRLGQTQVENRLNHLRFDMAVSNRLCTLDTQLDIADRWFLGHFYPESEIGYFYVLHVVYMLQIPSISILTHNFKTRFLRKICVKTGIKRKF